VRPFSGPYRQVLKAGIGISMAYRGFFFLQFFFQLFPLLTQVFLWRAVFGGPGAPQSIAGFGREAMLSYFILTNLLSMAGSGSLPWEMASEIRQGKLSQFLLRPFSYFLYQWHLLVGRLAIESFFLLVPAVLLLWATRSVLLTPAEPWRWWAFGASLVLGIQLSFLLNFILGCLAFWLLENSSIMHMLGPIEMLLAGAWFPLALLPGPLAALLSRSPFACQFYVPLTVYLGRASFEESLAGMAWQGAWIALLGFSAWLLWRKGLRAYTSVGG
jgi:ABC-2 type transport system permease protein